MTVRAPRPCLDCGKPQQPGSRCAACESKHNIARHQRRPWYGPGWKQQSARNIQAWVDLHGLLCPGYGRDPHPAADLTSDHRADGTLGVLCRSCNGRKGNAEPIFGQGA